MQSVCENVCITTHPLHRSYTVTALLHSFANVGNSIAECIFWTIKVVVTMEVCLLIVLGGGVNRNTA